MKKQDEAKELIIETLKIKACLKQKVFRSTINVFQDFKQEAQKLCNELHDEICTVDKDVVVEFIEKSDYEFHIKFGGDILVFFMHTNVFDFDKTDFAFPDIFEEINPFWLISKNKNQDTSNDSTS